MSAAQTQTPRTGSVAPLRTPVNAAQILRRAMPPWRRFWPGAASGFLTEASAVALLACSAWLIVYASEQPPVMFLGAAVVGVRAFALSRAAFRYTERLASHDAALRQLAQTRTDLVRRVIPLAPDGLGAGGTVHHIAFRVPDHATQAAWREELVGKGHQHVGLVDLGKVDFAVRNDHVRAGCPAVRRDRIHRGPQVVREPHLDLRPDHRPSEPPDPSRLRRRPLIHRRSRLAGGGEQRPHHAPPGHDPARCLIA